jgi:hypothetical protein
MKKSDEPERGEVVCTTKNGGAKYLEKHREPDIQHLMLQDRKP